MIPRPARIALALAAVALAATACGSSSSGSTTAAGATSSPPAAVAPTSPASTPAATPTPTHIVGTATGGAFCTQLKESAAEIKNQGSAEAKAIATGRFSAIKSDLSTYFEKIETQLVAVESTMTGAPANVQAALRTVNKTYGKLNAVVAGSTNLQQLDAGFIALGRDPALKPALSTLQTWGTQQCGS